MVSSSARLQLTLLAQLTQLTAQEVDKPRAITAQEVDRARVVIVRSADRIRPTKPQSTTVILLARIAQALARIYIAKFASRVCIGLTGNV